MGQEFYKKIYRPREFYMALYKGFGTIKYIRNCRKKNLLSKDFTERIILAVTQVNGCEICSYAHTKIALEQGMDNQEIQKILSGEMQNVPNEEAAAVFFAQHYADTRGNPSEDSWLRIVDEYGEEKALGILGSIRMIMIGNILGIPFSALISRFKGKPVKKTNLLYEAGMILSVIVFLPVALIHSFISGALKNPVI